MNKIYTINRGSKSIGFQHKQNHYVVGFKSVQLARNVQYWLHPEPSITIVRSDDIDLSSRLEEPDMKFIIDPNATLFIPKYHGNPDDPMNDGGYHLGIDNLDKFILYPISKMLGIALPYRIIEENEDEFVCKCHVVEPTMSEVYYKELLKE
jgi:hypothetical protein